MINECWYWEHVTSTGKVINSGFSRHKVEPTNDIWMGMRRDGSTVTVTRMRTVKDEPPTIEQYSRCSRTLISLGKPKPRTCAECGIGPCKTNPPAATPATGNWISIIDHAKNLRALDVALNGVVGAAEAPTLSDILSQVEREVRKLGRPIFSTESDKILKD